MLKWILAAACVVLVSLAISFAHMRVTHGSSRPRHDAAAFDSNRQIELQYEPVSLVRVLAAPERYEGRKVRVSGFVTLGFEDFGVHLDKAAYEAGLHKNALWLDRPKWLSPAAAQRLNRRYGEIAGTFVATENGMYGLYSGTLTDLRRIEPAFTQSDYERLRIQERREALMQHVFSGWFLTLVGWFALATLWAFSRRRT